MVPYHPLSRAVAGLRAPCFLCILSRMPGVLWHISGLLHPRMRLLLGHVLLIRLCLCLRLCLLLCGLLRLYCLGLGVRHLHVGTRWNVAGADGHPYACSVRLLWELSMGRLFGRITTYGQSGYFGQGSPLSTLTLSLLPVHRFLSCAVPARSNKPAGSVSAARTVVCEPRRNELE